MASPTSHLLITQEGSASVGTVRNLTDDFTTQDTAKWSGWGANVAISSGTGQITCTTSYSNLTSVDMYDARNAVTSVEVPQAPTVGNGTTSAFMQLNSTASAQRLRLGEEGGTLQASYDPGTGSWTVIASTTYNSTAHAIWRIRESGGQIYFETSSNGAAWSVLSGPTTTPVGLATVRVVLISGYYGTETSPGVARFDNFNATYADPPPSPRTFYVSNSGSDSNDGLSTGAPFLTVAKVNATSLYPGDQILFNRGDTWSEALTISGSGTSIAPITVSAYGSGAQPIIDGGGTSGVAGSRHPVEVYGSYVVLDNLEARGSSMDDFLLNGPDCTIQNCTARWGVRGIHQGNLGARAQILTNTITAVNVMVIGGGANDDYGAMAILLEGDAAVVAGNTISACYAASPDYVLDGSGIDSYFGTNGTIYNNVVTDCPSFFEAGGANSGGFLIHHNVYVSTLTVGSALTIHGQAPFGPITGIVAHHNTFVVTGGTVNNAGVWMSSGAELELQNNIIVATGSALMVDIGSLIIEAGNVLYGSASYNLASQSLDATSTVADPLFAYNYNDLHIGDSSPAVDRGADLGYLVDFAGLPARGTDMDSGAYEAGAGTYAYVGAGAGKRTPKATSAGTYAYVGAAAGKKTPVGAGAGTYAYAGAASGTRAPKATASGSYAYTGAASGTAPVHVPSGTGAGSYAYTGAASGKRAPVSTGAGAYAYAGAAAGKRTPKATASGTYNYTGAATGKRPAGGTAAGSYAYAGAATGKRVAKATSAGAYAYAGAAAGVRAPKASGGGAYAYAGSASGKRTPKATTAGSYSYTGAAAGKRVAKATTAGTYNYTGAAVGKRVPKGTGAPSGGFGSAPFGSLPFGWGPNTYHYDGAALTAPAPGQGAGAGSYAYVGSGVGKRVPKATGPGAYSYTGSATGKRTPKGQTAGTYAYVGAAVGDTPPNHGSGSGAYAYVGSATGKRTPKAAPAGNYAYTGTATGKRSPKASGSGAYAYVGHGSSVAMSKGTAAGSWQYAGAATGKRAPKATGPGAWQFAGAAVGSTALRGSGAGSWTYDGFALGSQFPFVAFGEEFFGFL